MPPADLLPVFNAQPGATLLLSPEWVIVGASDDYLAATLTQRKTIVGRYIFDAFPDNPEAPEANAVANVRASLERIMATKQPHEMAPQHYDVPDRLHPGRFVERHWLPRHTPVLDADGQVQFIIQSVQDITARRVAERRLRESRTREQVAQAAAELQRGELPRIFAQAPVAIAIFRGPEYRIELVNDMHLALWGRTQEQVLGLPLFEAIPEAAGIGFEELLQGVVSTGQPYIARELSARLLRHGQWEDVYFHFVYQPLRESDDTVSGVVVVATDITEQVRARQQAEQLNQELEARVLARTQEAQAARADAEAQRQELARLFEQAPVALAVIEGAQYVVELANPAVLQLWGRTRAQTLGTPLFELLPEISGQGFQELLDGVRATGIAHVAHEMPSTIDRDGRRATVYWNFVYQPRRGADGQVTGVTVVATDVSEQVQARRQAEQHGQELEARVAERTAQLCRQESQLQQILGQAPAAIATFAGPAHRFAFFNQAYQQLARRPPRLDEPLADVFPEAVAQGFVGLLDEVYATGRPFRSTEAPLDLAGPATGEPTRRYLDYIYQPLPDEHGRPGGILSFAVDVTEKVLARQQNEALQAQLLAAAQRQADEREAFYQAFEQTGVVVALLRGPSHRFEYVNPPYQAFNPGRQLIGLDVAVATPEVVAPGFITLLDHVYQTGETFYGREVPFTPPPAPGQPPRPAFFNFTYQAYREAGEIVGISIFATDVTEQVQARQAHEAQRLELEQLFRQAPSPIVILDGPDLVFQLINPAYQRIVPGRDLLGKPLLEAMPELVGTPIPDLFAQVYRTGEPVTVQEMPLMQARHEGAPLEEIYWTFTYQARRDAQGDIDGVRVFAHDVTEQVHARAQLHRLHQETAALNAQLRDFNAALAQQVTERTQTLQESRDLLQSVFDTTFTALLVLKAERDAQGTLLDFRVALANEEAARQTGRADLVGLPYLREFASLHDRLRRVLDTGEPQHHEYFDPRRGAPRWYIARFVKFGDGLIATSLDVTASKLAEQERLHNVVLLEQAEAVAGMGSWDYDRATGALRWSDGLYRLVGLAPSTAVEPARYFDYAVPDDRPVVERLLAYLTAGEGPFAETLRLHVGGQVKTVRLQAVVLPTAAGPPEQVLGVYLDISEVQRLTADSLRLRQQQALFEAVQQAQETERRRIAEGLHNGVGQTLFATKLRLDQLHAPMLRAAPALVAARREADALLADAIRQVRALSHELVPRVLEDFGLAVALTDMCRQLSSPQLWLRGLVLLDEQVPPLLQLALYRMAQELGLNIVKHARGATRASLELETTPGFVLLRAEDNGPGFAQDPATASGLGLRAIRDRVTLLGGTLDLGHHAGQGTFVRLRIPLPVAPADAR